MRHVTLSQIESTDIFITLQLHYTLCRWRWKTSILSAKTGPGADCGSDDQFLIAKFRLKLKKIGKTTRPFRYDLNHSSLEDGKLFFKGSNREYLRPYSHCHNWTCFCGMKAAMDNFEIRQGCVPVKLDKKQAETRFGPDLSYSLLVPRW